jgi:caffeoyl-CoA O-methyltransferase
LRFDHVEKEVLPTQDESTAAIRAFNDHVRDDDRVIAVMLAIRNGVTLIRRRQTTS